MNKHIDRALKGSARCTAQQWSVCSTTDTPSTVPNSASMWQILLLLLASQLLGYIAAVDNTCGFPDFSHKDDSSYLWIAKRAKHQQSRTHENEGLKDWNKYGQVKSGAFFENVNATKHSFEEFLEWVYGHEGNNVEFIRKIFLVPKEKPRFKTESASSVRSFGQSYIAAVTLNEGDSILEFSLKHCFSDDISDEGPASLIGAPWELRLVSKLLRERLKGSISPWFPFIKLLPSSVRSPLFFSDSELNNIEDESVSSEIHLMRKFAEASFQALQEEETAGLNFKEFVWALALVYTSTCRLEHKNDKGLLTGQSLHLLMPFFNVDHDSSGQVSIYHDGKTVKLVVNREVPSGSILLLKSDARTSSDIFIFRGYVPKSHALDDRTRVFSDLQDLVEWYFSFNGGVNNNKYLTMKVAQHALQNLCSDEKSEPLRPKFSVGPDGYIDPDMLCILKTLSNADQLMRLERTIFTYGSLGNLISRNGELLDKRDHMIANETQSLVRLIKAGCRERLHADDYIFTPALVSAISALQQRLLTLLESSSTSLAEDEVLLDSVSWEGLSDGGSHLCQTCQWETEELSFNDNLAVQIRYMKKAIISNALLKLSQNCTFQQAQYDDSIHKVMGLEDSTEHTEQFLKWCGEQGSLLSDKLVIENFHDSSSGNLVRGVKALQDIQQGETICILPLHMGLFDNEPVSNNRADSWHLAAARLLQERALGFNSRWNSYIGVLPRNMPTPINLEHHELKEVQWWPVLRELVQVRRAIKKSFQQLSGPTLAWAEFEDYRWAATMVHSRAFTLPVKEDEQYASYVLMPFMDMINHHFHYQADWMSMPVREGKLEIIARSHIHKGEQLFASFGPRSNDNLFLYYGFVLEDNPFDSAQIFSSFEEGVQWFVDVWNSSCELYSADTAAETFCRRGNWEKNWVQAKVAIEEYAAGITDQSPEWWELVSTWADYGYEYMQFQPAPSIYAKGVVDPNLLVAFEAVAKLVDLSSFSGDDMRNLCNDDDCDSKSVVKRNLKEFFSCMERKEWKAKNSVLRSLVCWKYLVQALTAEEQPANSKLIAKVSVGLRCLEILKLFPTALNEDKLLLEECFRKNENKIFTDNGSPSTHLCLARQYRYLKKLFLKVPLDHFLIL